MKQIGILPLLIGVLMNACTMNQPKKTTEELKNEIIQAEHDFATMAKEKGMAEAFLAFAAEDAVLNRNDSLIKGKLAIKAYFDKQTLTDNQLAWEPDFVDVAASGDLGHTYGKYTFSAVTPSGKTIQAEGVFNTVWKRQADGNWKFVWD
jgi:ketosteroid isomerase-like protein